MRQNKFFWFDMEIYNDINELNIPIPKGWALYAKGEYLNDLGEKITFANMFTYGSEFEQIHDILSKLWRKVHIISYNELPKDLSKKEYILCSAIYIDDGIKRKDTRCIPRNKEDGIVFCGWRHHNCFGVIYETISDKIDMSKAIQGFLTSKGNFLTREESKEMAYKIGQINKTISNTLTSEDLW